MKKRSVIGKFVGKCCDANVFNNNDMHLGRKLFENLFASEEYKRAIENGHYIGFLGHPEDPGDQNYKNACIVMTECKIDENDEVYGEFDLVDTEVGQVVKSFIDAGVNFGISIRGAGDVDGSGEVDPDTFVFRGFDLVTFPAYNDCIPEFQEIAASKDIDKQVKYKKVCASINKHLDKITSASAISVIQEQFKPGTEEYKKLEERKKSIESSSEVDVELLKQQVSGLQHLYAESIIANRKLEKDLVSAQMDAYESGKRSKRFVSAAKRIYSSQIADMDKEVEDMNTELESTQAKLRATSNKLKESVEASTKLNNEIKSLRVDVKSLTQENLKYKQKIESSTRILDQNKSTIRSLNARLGETVANSKQQASNRDEEMKRLQDRITASEKLVLEYQQAYANMYANALGVSLQNIPITSATTVEDLQKIIADSSLSSYGEVIDEPTQGVEFFDLPSSDEELVTM